MDEMIFNEFVKFCTTYVAEMRVLPTVASARIYAEGELSPLSDAQVEGLIGKFGEKFTLPDSLGGVRIKRGENIWVGGQE